MEFYIADEGFQQGGPYCSVHRQNQGFGKRYTQQFSGGMSVVGLDEVFDVPVFRPEAQGSGQFQGEHQMEVAEIVLQGVEEKYFLLTPVVQSRLVCSLLDCAEEKFGEID